MGLEIIKKLKKEKGYTSEELSRLSGVPLGTLNKILSGSTRDPKLETLKSLARVLECSLNEFDDASKEKIVGENIYDIAAHGVGYGEKLTEEQRDDVKLAIEIALTKYRKNKQ